MNKEIEDKIDVINSMITALGKLTNAEIRMTLAGEVDLAKKSAARRKQLRAQIDRLQSQVATKWTVSAATIREALRGANANVQDKILKIKKKINVAENSIKVIGQIDDAIGFLKKVV